MRVLPELRKDTSRGHECLEAGAIESTRRATTGVDRRPAAA